MSIELNLKTEYFFQRFEFQLKDTQFHTSRVLNFAWDNVLALCLTLRENAFN